MKPWETARTAHGVASVSFDGGLTQAPVPVGNPFVKAYSKTHLPKAPLSEFIEEMVMLDEEVVIIEKTNGEDIHAQGAGAMTMHELHHQPSMINKTSSRRCITLVEYDESLSHLWRQLRVV